MPINRLISRYLKPKFTPISHQLTPKVHYIHPKYINWTQLTPKVQAPKNGEYTQSTLYEYGSFLYRNVSNSNYKMIYIGDFQGHLEDKAYNYKWLHFTQSTSNTTKVH